MLLQLHRCLNTIMFVYLIYLVVFIGSGTGYPITVTLFLPCVLYP